MSSVSSIPIFAEAFKARWDIKFLCKSSKGVEYRASVFIRRIGYSVEYQPSIFMQSGSELIEYQAFHFYGDLPRSCNVHVKLLFPLREGVSSREISSFHFCIMYQKLYWIVRWKFVPIVTIDVESFAARYSFETCHVE